jgi:pyrroloquinoline quinone biosynthesis protein B
MGHMSVGGPQGTIAAFETISVARKVIIHMNNSNPLLLDDSAERDVAEAAGWTIAEDGMAFVL